MADLVNYDDKNIEEELVCDTNTPGLMCCDDKKKLDIINNNFNFDKIVILDEEHIPTKITEHLLTSDNLHVFTINNIFSIGKIKNPCVYIDQTNLGYIPVSPENFRVTQLSVGTNPDSKNRALVVDWYADGRDYTSYIDFYKDK